MPRSPGWPRGSDPSWDSTATGVPEMGLEIHPMCLGEVVVDGSFLVWGWSQGQSYRIPFSSYLILGGDPPVMVDAGARSVEDMHRDMGLETGQTEEQTLEANLARHGLAPEDIGTL